MAKTNVVNTEFVKGMELKEIRILLWRLCYEPENVLAEYGLKSDPKDLIEAILQKCKEEKIMLYFGGEKPCVDTLGVDLGIKNNIVRDILLRKCYYAVKYDNPDIGKIVTLFVTDYPEDLKGEKLYGGLRALGFSKAEATYLSRSCNLHPVGLFLKRLSDNEVESEPSGEVKKIDSMPNIQKKTKTSLDATALIANKEVIEEIFTLLRGEKDTEAVEVALYNAQKEVMRLQKLLDLVKSLADSGVTLEEILGKKEKLNEFFNAMAAL